MRQLLPRGRGAVPESNESNGYGVLNVLTGGMTA